MTAVYFVLGLLVVHGEEISMRTTVGESRGVTRYAVELSTREVTEKDVTGKMTYFIEPNTSVYEGDQTNEITTHKEDQNTSMQYEELTNTSMSSEKPKTEAVIDLWRNGTLSQMYSEGVTSPSISPENHTEFSASTTNNTTSSTEEDTATIVPNATNLYKWLTRLRNVSTYSASWDNRSLSHEATSAPLTNESASSDQELNSTSAQYSTTTDYSIFMNTSVNVNPKHGPIGNTATTDFEYSTETNVTEMCLTEDNVTIPCELELTSGIAKT